MILVLQSSGGWKTKSEHENSESSLWGCETRVYGAVAENKRSAATALRTTAATCIQTVTGTCKMVLLWNFSFCMELQL